MTSASELLYNRRSRFGRDTVDLGFDSSLDRSFHHRNGNRHHHRHDNESDYDNIIRQNRLTLDRCDPFRRPYRLFRHPSCRVSHPEHESVCVEQGSNQSASARIINSENFSIHSRQRSRSSGNERLPGAVILARERLLKRLRDVSLSGNRQSNRASSSILQDTFGDAVDQETEISWGWPALGTLSPFIDSTSQTDQLSGPEERSKRSPGLTQDAMDSLRLEVFIAVKNDGESRVSWECSICLESFLEGDELICLPCGHRFHFCCLDPWVRNCGDCPYCRTGIVVSSCRSIT